MLPDFTIDMQTAWIRAKWHKIAHMSLEYTEAEIKRLQITESKYVSLKCVSNILLFVKTLTCQIRGSKISILQTSFFGRKYYIS